MSRRYEHEVVVDTSVVQAAGDRSGGPNPSARALSLMLEKRLAVDVSTELLN